MATYIFDRGSFGRWGVPMWAGETRAFRLIRLLKKQKIERILYEEGPLGFYSRTVRHHRPEFCGGTNHQCSWENDPVKDVGFAPNYFKVSF